jgi:hypothetical protein
MAPDLDLRPGEPTRSTLLRWVDLCPGCGAAAPDLAALPSPTAGVVRSVEYAGLRTKLPDCLPFLRWAMLCRPEQRREALLQAAWVADDAGDAAEATALRRAAAFAWGEPESPESALRLVDVLRRAGEFELARARAAALDPDGIDEISAQILVFQRARIAAGDAGRYLLSSALRPPASRPHVAQGRPKPPKRRFFGRLFGG